MSSASWRSSGSRWSLKDPAGRAAAPGDPRNPQRARHSISKSRRNGIRQWKRPDGGPGDPGRRSPHRQPGFSELKELQKSARTWMAAGQPASGRPAPEHQRGRAVSDHNQPVERPSPAGPGRGYGGAGIHGDQSQRPVGKQGRHPPAPGGDLEDHRQADEVRVVEGETQARRRPGASSGPSTPGAAAAPSEIDLRGMMTDEAIAVLDRFLDML